MHQQYFFGYGSLVNQRTHSYPEGRPARLKGWRRMWCHTEASDQVFLSAHPVTGGTIDGLIAQVPGQDWHALDHRETGYLRQPVTDQLDHDHPAQPHVQVYAIPRDRHLSETGGHILLSYLDVVVQGFLQTYGPDGVAGFFDSTDGWDRVVLDDRAAPRYPRHQQLTPSETALVNGYLDRLPVRVRRTD
ncbi:gamma-glutamylcyclotransferase family protein [Fluviibacterium sp. DFM31]|uniref:Gamma-glutamylcyclotransferase family protein n=1 Tax=Meridianimarinicoccus marinus TaxID=3231483 RepID=A0ABV3L3R5_9RHOB